MAEEHKNSSTAEAATATNPSETSIEESRYSKATGAATAARASDDDAESQSKTNSPEESPLKIPFFLPRPPTPPPSSTPSKLAQLPNSIPPTTRDFNTLASKESFASLIRNRLPDPDPSAFRLNDPAQSSEELPSPSLPSSDRTCSLAKRSGTGSMGVLMTVVNSAKSRRRREAAAGNVASEEEPSEGERTDGETGESVSITSGSDGSGKARDKSGEKKEKKRGKGEKRKGEEEKEVEDMKPPEERRKERRRNLWEEL